MGGFIEFINYAFMFATLYFEVFLFLSFLEKKGEIKHESFTPPVTVIVPCFNEEKTVVATIHSILDLDYPKENLHIIIVDDGSTDKTLEKLRVFENNGQIKIYSKKNEGKYKALNFAIKLSQTDFVGCLDADSFVEKDALTLIMKKFTRTEVVSVTPSIVIHKADNILRKMQKAEYHYGNFFRKAFSLIGAIHIAPGPFSFFRKEIFEKIGYYKHAYNTEDMEMAIRIQKNRMIIENEPRAVVHTVGPGTVRKLYKQRERWVSGFLGNLLDYREMLFSKKYGDLGMIVLPFAGLGIIMTVIFIFLTLFQFGQSLWKYIERIRITGFQEFSLNFDWFFVNTSTISLLAVFLIFLTLSITIFGQRIATGKWRFSLDPIYFVLLYSLIAPFWLSKAIYNNIRSINADWR